MEWLKRKDRAILFNMLIAAGFAVVMLFSILTVGTYIVGTLSNELVDTLPAAASRTALQNRTVSTLGNISAGFDNTIEIVVVAAIIVVIVLPLMALVAVKKIF